MTVTEQEFTTEWAEVAGTRLYLLKGGSGRPCLVLHGIEGHEGWRPFHAALAEQATVYAPSHPGDGHTECPTWVRAIAHQAVFYQWFLQHQGLSNVDLIGVGMGGWIAAQMAVMCSDSLRRLVLIGATGVKPAQGEIFDVFIEPWQNVIQRGFLNAQASPEYQSIYANAPIAEFGGIREAGRVMSMKMCFKPYMYDPSLEGMLGKINIPTLLIWGQEDRIVPVECAYQFQRAIPDARLALIEQCGHFAHLDRPDETARVIRDFLQLQIQ